ncbi:MAG: peptide chain release factor 2 [Candidatus Cellulosilyticum pullistercoris]|uniref:Peptide chain release factor 2 n=1 Tax=Candidatus Cellulosilyticum pullistercoris TaxID=2838521 RepID=A0A9E2KA63_9FIRM|nr:peptide chain release factor 2 [Candidatus Cellulosilyticum pullistercoris]
MLEMEQLQLSLEPFKVKLCEMGNSLDIEKCQEKVMQLEEVSMDNAFWTDTERAQKVLQELKGYKDTIEKYNKLCASLEDILVLIEMANEEEDMDLAEEAKEEAKAFREKYEAMRIATMLDGEYDRNNAILELHSGAGGTESCDWVAMLYRMYTRWAEAHGYKVEVLDYLEGDEAGIKSVTIQVSGENAYGYLKSEKGIHRLVRISPFDSSGRRHTSFASCDVMPELTDEISIEIKQEDLRIDTYRSTGAGGQHVNTTDSAVRITHIPTNIVVQCQNERSQIQNRERAMQMLKAKLHEKEEEERLEKMDGIRGEKKEIAWGSQIRSYVFHPYNLVKDHRTSEETGNSSAVMDGDIDRFMNAYLAWIHQK